MNLRRFLLDLPLTGVLWSLAGTLLYLDLHILPQALSPLAAGLADGTELALGLARAGVRVFVPAVAAFGLFAAIPAWVWKRSELRQLAPLMPILAAVATMPTFAVRGLVGVILPLSAVVAAIAYWFDRGDEARRRWFYLILPATLSVLSIVGVLYAWLARYPMRETAGRASTASVAIFAVVCLVAALPALLQLKGPALRGVVLLVGAWFVAQHPFDDNFEIETPDRIVGQSTQRPNVILIVVDTLRADVLSYADESAPPTPTIDALAAESVVFSNAISPSSWTFPAMTSLMTGLAPMQSARLEQGVFNYRTVARPTIAENLAAIGYSTQGIIGNHLLYRPFQMTAGLQRIDTYANRAFGEAAVSNELAGWGGKSEASHHLLTRRLTEQAIEYAGNLTNELPSFLWLHYFDPHDPYLPPSEFLEPQENEKLSSVESQRRLYRAEVRFVDSEIGRFLDVLKQRGLYEDSIIVLTSDHGESFLEHGELLHGSDLYQELIHVPLIVRMPNGAARKTVPNYVPTNALLPTILDLLEIDEQKDSAWPPSLAELIHSDDASYDYPVVSGANHKREPQWTIVRDGMKYIFREETGREEVYDLAADPGEMHSLVELPEPFTTEARQALARHLEFATKTLRAEGLGEQGPADQQLLDRMKSLGYIQ